LFFDIDDKKKKLVIDIDNTTNQQHKQSFANAALAKIENKKKITTKMNSTNNHLRMLRWLKIITRVKIITV